MRKIIDSSQLSFRLRYVKEHIIIMNKNLENIRICINFAPERYEDLLTADRIQSLIPIILLIKHEKRTSDHISSI